MKKFKSISAILGLPLAIIGIFATSNIESKAQGYNYKIEIGVIITPYPDGDKIRPLCIHGPGLCRGTSEQ
ncbi:MAG: hypothetical protein ACI9UV_001327 [Algoriphagus sp.]|jgi:hypothetical protein|tara:strand:+ start:431 stop:640 length:210 start_codon:yes stop_codon:yes gene_type:complete